MSSEINTTTPTYSLGEILKKNRSEKGLDLISVADETRISLKVLQAMEEGDYPSLPADVFTRGFYTLYAQVLQLDPEEILRQYNQEIGDHPNLSSNKSILPGSSGGEVLEFAERSRSFHFSSIGFFIILLLLFGAFLCWYFSWNPATFLSQKLRSYQPKSEQIERPLESKNSIPAKTPLYKIVKVTPKSSISPSDVTNKQVLDSRLFSQYLDH